MTDWGAPLLDIARWAINESPIEIRSRGDLPIADEGRNGIMLTGTKGQFFVSRGTISGEPIQELTAMPLRREDFTLYAHDNVQRPERVGKLDTMTNRPGFEIV